MDDFLPNIQLYVLLGIKVTLLSVLIAVIEKKSLEEKKIAFPIAAASFLVVVIWSHLFLYALWLFYQKFHSFSLFDLCSSDLAISGFFHLIGILSIGITATWVLPFLMLKSLKPQV